MAAYKFAIDYAALVNGAITVVHILDIPVVQEAAFGLQPSLYSRDVFRSAMSNASRIYERMRAHHPAEVPVRFKAIYDDLVSGLADYSRENHVDLLIMSTHGASELEEFVTGSHTKKIARHAPTPVLTIPKETPVDSIQNIVFPNALEPGQDRLIREVSELQGTLGAKLHLLLVNTPANLHFEDESRRLLNAFAEYHCLKDFTINFRYDDSEANGIASFANEIGGDLIAMGTHRRKGLDHLLNGSITEEVLSKIECPFWISKLDRV